MAGYKQNILKTANNSISDIDESVSDFASSTAESWSTLASNFNSIEEEKAAGTQLINGMWDSATTLLKQKLDYVKELWNTKEVVTIGTLANSVAPYVEDPTDFWKNLVGRLDNLVATLTGTSADDDDWLGLLKSLGSQYLDEALSNPDVTDAIGSLNSVQVYATAFNTIMDGIATIREILDAIAPFKKPISILVDLISAAINPAALQEAGFTITDYVQYAVSELKKWAILAIEDFVFGLEIKVPALLVTTFNTLSFKEAVNAYDKLNNTKWMSAFIDSNDEFSQWASNRTTAFSKVEGWLKTAEDWMDKADLGTWTNGKLSVDKLTQYIKSAYLATEKKNLDGEIITDDTNTNMETESSLWVVPSVGRIYNESRIKSISAQIYNCL